CVGAGMPRRQRGRQRARADDNDCAAVQPCAQLGDLIAQILQFRDHDWDGFAFPDRLCRGDMFGLSNNIAEPSECYGEPFTPRRAHVENQNPVVGWHCSPLGHSNPAAYARGQKSAPVPYGTRRQIAAPGALTCCFVRLGTISYHKSTTKSIDSTY